MKKARKHLADEAIRIYEEIMRRLLLNNLSLLFVLLFGLSSLSLAAASTAPVFLLFNDNAKLSSVADELTAQGAQVRHQVEPNILIVDLPTSITAAAIPNLKGFYTGPIALNVLKPYGPLAAAAGQEWNRRLLKEAPLKGTSAFGTMKSLVQENSLPAPADVSIQNLVDRLQISWTPVNGAPYYDIQISRDENFTNLFSETRSAVPSAEIPVPLNEVSPVLFIRIRAMDHAHINKPNEDLEGAWSKPVSVRTMNIQSASGAPVPVLSSPVNPYESEGLVVILEWSGLTEDRSRVQLSFSPNFNSLFIDQVVPTREFAVPEAALHVGDTLYWRVQGWGSQKGGWSETRMVKIGEPRPIGTDMFINPEAPK